MRLTTVFSKMFLIVSLNFMPLSAIAQGQLASSQNPELQSLLRQGREYVDAGNYDKAIATYQQAATIDRDNARIFSGLGYLYTLQENFAAAQRSYQRAISLEPDNPSFYYALGYSLAQTGDNDNAIRAYYRATKLAPLELKYHQALAVVLLRDQDYSSAIAVYQRILALNPEDVTAQENLLTLLINQGRTDEAREFLASTNLNLSQHLDLQLQLVAVLLHKKQLEVAIETLEDIEQRHRDNPQFQVELGKVWQRINRYDAALAAYTRALELQPRFIEAEAHVGDLLLLQQNYLEAIVVYRRLIEFEPDNPYNYHQLGLALQGRNREEEAIEAWQKALTLYTNQNNSQGIKQVESLLGD